MDRRYGAKLVMNYEPSSVARKKQEYQVPRVITISLRPEEAVLGHCKSMSAAGPVGATCVALVGPCGSIGS